MPTNIHLSHCIIMPFFNRVAQVVQCVELLLKQQVPGTDLVLIDDASTESLEALKPLLAQDNVTLLQHQQNRGVSAARNTGLHWCRNQKYLRVIMIDSDCVPGPDFIFDHLALHEDHPEAVCIGAAIIGRGNTVWSNIDGAASWVHAAPHYKFHAVTAPYHLPTTNFSLKIDLLPEREFLFDERLYTGEDCLLIREFQQKEQGVFFSPKPVIYHRDRDLLSDVFKHHYKWGHHQYFIQLGGDISSRCFNPLYRIVFFLFFLIAAPFYALAGALLNITIPVPHCIFSSHLHIVAGQKCSRSGSGPSSDKGST
jgi:glycosyltransferase involved in cell wall biosynthesis